jgi:hypothetical protein
MNAFSDLQLRVQHAIAAKKATLEMMEVVVEEASLTVWEKCVALFKRIMRSLFPYFKT